MISWVFSYTNNIASVGIPLSLKGCFNKVKIFYIKSLYYSISDGYDANEDKNSFPLENLTQLIITLSKD